MAGLMLSESTVHEMWLVWVCESRITINNNTFCVFPCLINKFDSE